MKNPLKNKYIYSLYVFLLIILHWIPRTADAQTCSSTFATRLTASNGSATDRLGTSTAISGNLALVGAPRHNTPNTFNHAGAVYAARKSDSNWSIFQEIMSPDIEIFANFGASISIDGNWAIIGAPAGEADSANGGSAYIYFFDGNNWVYRQKLWASDRALGDYFGFSVGISQQTLVIGSYGKQFYAGLVYVYKFNGSTWVLDKTLNAPDGAANDFLGYSIAISGNTIVAGAYGSDAAAANAGAVYVFRYNGTTWGYSQKLLALGGQAADNFGWSVAISGANIVVGAPDRDELGTSSGAAYVFNDNGSSFSQVAKLLAADGGMYDWFGRHVAMSGKGILIGSEKWSDDVNLISTTGAAYYFSLTSSSWTQQLIITEPSPWEIAQDHFGLGVALDNDSAFIGAPDANNPHLDMGSAFIFDISCTTSLSIASSSPPDGFIDPLEDQDATNGALYGIKDISITFSSAVKPTSGTTLSSSNFTLGFTRNGAAVTDLQSGVVPVVSSVAESNLGPYTIHLSSRIPLGAWTKITAVNVIDAISNTPISSSGSSIILGYLPADLTQDGKVSGDDINRWLSIKSGSFVAPSPLTPLMLLDQKRNGVIAGEDITRAIQLTNGIPGTTLRAWNGFDLGVKPQKN